jgi:serine/threonine protein kinase
MTYFSSSIENVKIDLDKFMMAAIGILQSIHTAYLLHRDIKPKNFMMKNGELYLIDFGLAAFYLNENGEHVVNSYPEDTLVGTPKYTSFFVDYGHTPSRRDDLISLGYIYLYLFSKSLPWSHEGASVMDISNSLVQQRAFSKSWEQIEPFCKSIDSKIHSYLHYLYHLQFGVEPNYEGLSLIWRNQ